MSVRGVLFVLLVPLLLLGCARGGGPWEKPDMTDESKAYDMRNCREYARERLNSRAVRQTEDEHSHALAAQDTAHNDDLAPLRLMLQSDHERLERRFYDDCMRANGYRSAR